MQGASMAVAAEFESRHMFSLVWLLRFASVWRLQLIYLELLNDIKCKLMQPYGSMLHCGSYSRAQ